MVLNPVRAGMVARPGDWRWSSYLDMVGEKAPSAWLTTDGMMAEFASDRREAVRRYIAFVLEGIGEESIWRDRTRQIYLGDEAFVERMQTKCEGLSKTVGVSKAHISVHRRSHLRNWR